MTWYLVPELRHCRRIFLKDIQRDIFIGAYEHEKHAPQPVLLNIEVYVQTQAEEDRLENAYNYDLVLQTLDTVLQEQPFALQETLIDKLAESLLKHPLIKAALVRSEKTQAYPTAASAGIEIFRLKDAHD